MADRLSDRAGLARHDQQNRASYGPATACGCSADRSAYDIAVAAGAGTLGSLFAGRSFGYLAGRGERVVVDGVVEPAGK